MKLMEGAGQHLFPQFARLVFDDIFYLSALNI